MPRCPKGTRRNKKTGNCEPNDKVTTTRCPKGTRRNKKTGLCEETSSNQSELDKCHTKLREAYKKMNSNMTKKDMDKYFKMKKQCMNIENKISNMDTNKHLTEREVDDLLEHFSFNEEDFGQEYRDVRRDLLKLKYDPTYIHAFTGKRTKNLHEMAEGKLSAYLKYGDEI